MSDIRERLNRLKSSSPGIKGDEQRELISDLRSRIERVMQRSNREERKQRTPYQGPGIEALVPGKIIPCESCEVFVARRDHETNYLHGNIRLEDIYQESLEVFGEISSHPELAYMNPDQTVFIDTETTGLSGGTGTYAFQVGIGFFDQGKFVVEQYLMRDQAEEMEMLSLLRERLSRFRFLVSFNGKSFDIPLLESRFILSRIRPDVLALPHLDLLYPARRIWKRSLESCRLSNLEQELLGLERLDDVPGELIPGIYFQYLEDGDPTRMERVFYHNRLDILTLVTLTVLIHRLVTDKAAYCRRDGMEQYSLGRIHFDRGRLDDAVACLKSALTSCTYTDQEWEVMKHLSIVYKRSGELKLAVQAWKDMIGIDADRGLFPFIELAKYYEHREKDYERAEGFARRAEMANQYLHAVNPEEIEHRIHRLREKQEKDI